VTGTPWLSHSYYDGVQKNFGSSRTMFIVIKIYRARIGTFEVRFSTKYTSLPSGVDIAGRESLFWWLVIMLLLVLGGVELNLGLAVEQEIDQTLIHLLFSHLSIHPSILMLYLTSSFKVS
jgi:hypothetical protein